MTGVEAEAQATLVARLTPAIPSAIATIAVRGPRAVELVISLVTFKHAYRELLPLLRVRYGLWNAAASSDAAEQVVVCRTGDAMVEIHCHGGNAICQQILQDLAELGGQSVAAADFPSDGIGEIQREAEEDLLRATTDRAAAIL